MHCASLSYTIIMDTTKNTMSFKNLSNAVCFRNGIKEYRNHKLGTGVRVINNFNMNVPHGTINIRRYCLMGPSGCGKSTVLSCILGIEYLDSGCLSVNQQSSSNKLSKLRKIFYGYMPQDTALFFEFSISETFDFFGRLYGMTPLETEERLQELQQTIHLPDKHRRVGGLSGGEQRRVSLAISLLHKPSLVLLDEPTVGLDPFLRKNVWDYLEKLRDSNGATIIITTHYVEESRNADLIGVMKQGCIIAECAPDALLSIFQSTFMEGALFKLYEYHDDAENSVHEVNDLSKVISTHLNFYPSMTLKNYGNESIQTKETGENDIKNDSLQRIAALIFRNFLLMYRNLPYVFFVLLLPALQLSILCLTVGNAPEHLYLGVVNYEERNCNFSPDYKDCATNNLSCSYLNHLVNQSINMKLLDNEDVATEHVKTGEIFGYLVFSSNFSEALADRFISGSYAPKSSFKASQISLELDNSNVQVGNYLKQKLLEIMDEFLKNTLSACGFDNGFQNMEPISFKEPIYGSIPGNIRQFTAPSTLVGILFFFPICSSSIQLILEKKNGTKARITVAGVRNWENIVAVLVTEGIIIVLQATISLLVMINVFAVKVHGSLVGVFALIILVGLTGFSFGCLISTFCNNILQAVVIAMAMFFPSFLLSGMISPVESMPLVLRQISYLLPCTLACESLRSIISRGWVLTHPKVWPGFLSIVIWIVVYWTLYYIFMKLVPGISGNSRFLKRMSTSSRNKQLVM